LLEKAGKRNSKKFWQCYVRILFKFIGRTVRMRDWLIKLKLFYMDMDCRLVGCITILIIVWLLTRWTQFNLSCVWLCGYQNRENNSPRKACCPELRSKIMHIYYRGYIYEWCLFWEYIILYRFIFFFGS